MSQEADFTRAVVDIRNELAQVFNEALKTHGPAAVMTAVSMFAGAAVHQAEHLSDDPRSRQIVIGQFLMHFHAWHAQVCQECDDQQEFVRRPPEGQA